MSDLRFAAEIAVGKRPAGGPYITEIHDGQRFCTHAEYEIRVTCTEYCEDGDPTIVCTGLIHVDAWRELLRDVLSA